MEINRLHQEHPGSIPTVYIKIQDEIQEYKIPGRLLIQSSDPLISSGPHVMGISIRGNSSKRYEKKSFDLQLGKENDWLSSHHVSLMGMRKDDDWKMSADFADPLFLRNIVSHKVFQEMRGDIDQHIEFRHVEVYLNHDYRGIYTIFEQEDRKLYGLKKNKKLETRYNQTIADLQDLSMRFSERWVRNLSNEAAKGLYKVRNTLFPIRHHNFEALYKASLFGADLSVKSLEKGIYQKYPKIEQANYQKPLADFIDFIEKTDKEEFDQKIWHQLDFDNLVDYLLLLAVSGSADNFTANYILKFDQDKMFHFLPWDLDNTWRLVHYKTGKVIATHDSFRFESNKLFARIFQNERFIKEFKARWFRYRKTIFQNQHLKDHFLLPYQQLKDSGALERDYKRWGRFDKDLGLDEMSEIHLVLDWIDQRLDFLDEKIQQL